MLRSTVIAAKSSRQSLLLESSSRASALTRRLLYSPPTAWRSSSSASSLRPKHASFSVTLRSQRLLSSGATTGKSPSTAPRAANTSAATTSSPSPSRASWISETTRNRWKWFARILRYSRIPVLVLSVYGLGYQQGIMDDSRNPEQTRGALLESVLQSVGAHGMDHVNQLDEAKEKENYLWSSADVAPQTKRIARIGRVLVNVAKEYVQERMKQAAAAVESRAPLGGFSKDQLLQAVQGDETFQKWSTAMRRLEGDWIYMVIEAKLPNAFVTELLPKRIFVTTAMLDESIVGNDDELAMVLGHEISHLILGHLTEQNQIETMLRVLEVLLLSMDPTEGVLSVLFVGALAWARAALSASYSREHEREADTLGLQLAARACFETKKGAVVFKKLDLHPGNNKPLKKHPTVPTTPGDSPSVVLDGTTATEQVAGQEKQRKRPALVRFVDSHPPSQERYEALIKAAEQENANKYCSSVHKRLKEYVLR